MKIKICGLMRLSDVDAVNAATPDYVGFIFAKSRRRISRELACLFKQRLNPGIQSVGVFVNAPVNKIHALYEQGILDAVQLHGDEDGAYMDELKKRVSVPVIKAVRVQSTDQIKKAQALPCDYLLLDTYNKKTAGGTGESFDWSLIPKLDKPYFLAGGLDTHNILQAASLGAYCLDMSSGVETEGVKDARKINEAIDLVRRMEP